MSSHTNIFNKHETKKGKHFCSFCHSCVVMIRFPTFFSLSKSTCCAVSAVRGLSTVSKTVTTTSKNSATRIKKNVIVPGLKHGMDYIQLGDSDLVVSKVCSKYYD
jgi:hypothetical protein